MGSLCILLCDDKDWKDEAKRMEKVLSCCVIAVNLYSLISHLEWHFRGLLRLASTSCGNKFTGTRYDNCYHSVSDISGDFFLLFGQWPRLEIDRIVGGITTTLASCE